MYCSGQEIEVPTSVGILKCMVERNFMPCKLSKKCFMAIMMTWGLDFLPVLIHRKFCMAICNGFLFYIIKPFVCGEILNKYFNNGDPDEMPHYEKMRHFKRSTLLAI